MLKAKIRSRVQTKDMWKAFEIISNIVVCVHIIFSEIVKVVHNRISFELKKTFDTVSRNTILRNSHKVKALR